MAAVRYAQVHTATGFVANVIRWNDDFDIGSYPVPAGYEMVLDADSVASPGFSWDGTAFAPPPVPTAEDIVVLQGKGLGAV